jgi:hypothetical protein
MSYIGGDELIFYTDNNEIYSGGFNVNSIMMKSGIPPFSTLNKDNNQTGGNVSDLFKDLVVPSWLLSQDNIFNGLVGGGGSNKNNNQDSDSDADIIDDDLHNKLLDLVSVSDAEIKNKKKKTRRFKSKVNSKNKITKKKN